MATGPNPIVPVQAPVQVPVQAPDQVPVPVAPASTPGQRSDKIPDPSKFDGIRSALRPFITQLRLKMIGNADRFTSTQQQLVYAINLLSGGALGQVMPVVNGARM
ncbi:uncharacterized protein H6S33_010541 [Morchella sextelata]|uniref:uncharacterized protein n=1 Tax=Morchella sextelata TaxID=1174677 RepID=UPI001D04A077|nr:uncharacterized protein H6S33_010541 [Morchella sextelata]KAH0611276.1 hypothetical protein H6S33_010541 [Morchella sextelata]